MAKPKKSNSKNDWKAARDEQILKSSLHNNKSAIEIADANIIELAFLKYLNESDAIKLFGKNLSHIARFHFDSIVNEISINCEREAYLRIKTSSFFSGFSRILSPLQEFSRLWSIDSSDLSEKSTSALDESEKSTFYFDELDYFIWNNGLLWSSRLRNLDVGIKSAENKVLELAKIENAPWRLSSGEELLSFAWNAKCPWRSKTGSTARLFSRKYYVTTSGCLDLDFADNVDRGGSGYLLAVNDAFKSDLIKLICWSYLNDFKIISYDDEVNILSPLSSGVNNIMDDKTRNILKNSGVDLASTFRTIDQRCAKLPVLDASEFTDPNKGLWEFWGADEDSLRAVNVRARNPVRDIQDGMVAIDFGTSSTVVAYEQNGVGQLLRIGVTDFWEKPKPAHYENPTVLEIVDFESMLKAWTETAYRPSVAWDDVRCSHEALHNFRNNDTKPEVVASILTKIKQWALREGDGTRIRLMDQAHRVEHELAPLTLRSPVKGKPLTVDSDYPFDPVELYAWFLGLTINWRGRGIFLRYYMTFPVDYPREVKEKILASFRRGLQRSLPSTLISQPEFEHFTVEERASEPAAYAAIALSSLKIEPSKDGVAYAVFDFGGGTTDFDFGIYRLPTEDEEDNGIERVFEHFGNGGDKFLGGENLLEHLAFQTFKHNLELCRKSKITFSKPLDAEAFQGSEMFLANTQYAATNTLMLMSKLRAFWERGEQSSSGAQKMDFLDREGKKVSCDFAFPYSELRSFLVDRITEGVHNFFSAMHKAFGEKMPSHVHVLLAGNASLSAIVRGAFGLLPGDDELAKLFVETKEFVDLLFGECRPEFDTHAPLASDDADINRPTGKTGVALGLLELCPGSSTRVVNHAVKNATGDAPFQHYVGRIRLKKFQVGLYQGGEYQKWVELGPVSEDRVFNLYHSQAALAHTGTMELGDAGLILKRQHFAGDTTGHKTFARPVKPHEIEICTAPSQEAAESGQVENLKLLKLN